MFGRQFRPREFWRGIYPSLSDFFHRSKPWRKMSTPLFRQRNWRDRRTVTSDKVWWMYPSWETRKDVGTPHHECWATGGPGHRMIRIKLTWAIGNSRAGQNVIPTLSSHQSFNRTFAIDGMVFRVQKGFRDQVEIGK